MTVYILLNHFPNGNEGSIVMKVSDNKDFITRFKKECEAEDYEYVLKKHMRKNGGTINDDTIQDDLNTLGGTYEIVTESFKSQLELAFSQGS